MRLEIVKPFIFTKVEDHVIYMIENFKDNLVIQELDFKVPLINLKGIYLGVDGILVGYLIKPPKNHKLYQNSLVVGSNFDNTTPYGGLPGLQIYSGDNGVVLATTKITRFFTKIDKPM